MNPATASIDPKSFKRFAEFSIWANTGTAPDIWTGKIPF
jgi:hypothetical protein